MNTATVSTVDEDDAIFLKTEYKVVRLQIRDILYVEGMSEYLKIYVEGQPKPLIILLSMKKMEERLPVSSFMRIHRSYIINLKKIQEVNKNRVIMDSETYLPIGDLYREKFQDYINTKFLGK
jgi:DNA-binding LytR/AlgR family response regulator